jgi:3-oxoacyl-[acyl-carrier-protein] synthase-1
MSIANVLAGISRISRVKDMRDKKFERVALGTAKYISTTESNLGRIKKLLMPAIQEAIAILNEHDKFPQPLNLIVGLPRHRPGLDRNLVDKLEKLIAAFNIGSKIKLIPEFICQDHDAGVIALQKIIQKQRENEFTLIGGVDSFVSNETVTWMERENRLYCSTNKNGFTPGEAAACCLVCDETNALNHRLPIKARIFSSATAKEPSATDLELVNTGKGLSQAFGSVLEQLPENERVQEIFCTLKGVRTEAEEFAFSLMKISSQLESPGSFTSLSQRWGDIGAASAPALMVYAIEKKSLGYSKSGHHLVFTQSPGGSRSAVLIQTT